MLISFFLSASFLDIDHYIFYLFKFKDLNYSKAYRFFESIEHKPRKAFCILHTIEFLLLVAVLGFVLKSQLVYGLLIGLIFHLLIDLGQAIYFREVNYRWWSIYHYISSDIP